MKNFKEDLQGVTKEFKTLRKKTKQLADKLAKTAVAELERAQAVIKLKPPAQHTADALKALTKQTENLIKAVNKFEKDKAAKKAKPKAKAKPARKAAAKKAPAKKKSATQTATDQVVNIIKRSKKGVDVPTLVKKTGFEDKKIRNIVFKASKQGKIKRAGRGIYVPA
jgi:septal ring factor EnvC (AmiA/AmiB activator)